MVSMVELANKIRKTVLEMIYKAQSSHIGSCFSCIDLLTVIYMKSKLEDKILISKGWVAAPVYALLAEKGIIPKKDLERYCKEKEKQYIGLLEPMKGVSFAGGSMSMGIAAGVGFALAKKLNNDKSRVYVLESDGGLNGGITWEAAAIAAHHRLDNLIVIIDMNGLQAMGSTSDILNMEPLRDKWKSFGWEVREVNGHNHITIEQALFYPPLYKGKPIVILAKTIKGKGVSFFENNNLYHYKNLTAKEYLLARKELNG